MQCRALWLLMAIAKEQPLHCHAVPRGVHLAHVPAIAADGVRTQRVDASLPGGANFSAKGWRGGLM